MRGVGVVRAAGFIVDVNVGWRSGFGARAFGAGWLEGQGKDVG